MTLNLQQLVKQDEPSYYVLAGAMTLVSILRRFIESNGFKYFSADSLSSFFSLKCNKFLHSYGLDIGPKTKFNSKFNEKISKILHLFKDEEFFRKTEIYLDSGGFQVSIGRATREMIPELIQSYNMFLSQNSELFDFAFSLDLVPGPNCVAFDTFCDVLECNLESYITTSKLDPDIRSKVIYIHHFRTPKLLSIFREILFETDLFEKFNNFATGGIVANLASDTNVNVMLYIIPLIDLLCMTKKVGRKFLRFHILGGASYRDIFFYELVKEHVKNKHNIDLTITFDSSAIFKALMIARYINVLESGRILNMSLRESDLESRWVGSKKIRDRLQEVLDDFITRNRFEKVDFKNPYDQETGTFKKRCSLFLMLYVLDFFFEIQKYLRDVAKEIYPLYESGDIQQFNHQVEKVLRNLNRGKSTRKQRSKSYSIARSLDALADLDMDYANHLVNKFLSKDEFTNLMNQELLTF